MTTPILPTDGNRLAATYYIDVSSFSIRGLLDALQAVCRHFEWVKSEAQASGELNTDYLMTMLVKYLGIDNVSYLASEDYCLNNFPSLYNPKAGASTLISSCFDFRVFNVYGASPKEEGDWDLPLEKMPQSGNIFIVESDAGKEYHAIVPLVLYFREG